LKDLTPDEIYYEPAKSPESLLEYLYFNEIEKDEREFRFRLWEVSGLRTRQAFKPHFHQDLIEKQKIEKERIEGLMKVIRSSPYYSKLKQQQIWKLDNYGLPRMDGWQKLIQQFHIHQHPRHHQLQSPRES
jgi:hypothetical protein